MEVAVRAELAQKFAEAVDAPIQLIRRLANDEAEDVAETIHWVVSRPAHLNVNVIEIMPVAQAFNTCKYDRKA